MTRWQKKDMQYLWHPYTQMKDCIKSPPILIKKAKGLKLFTDEGNFFLDTISSWWCNVHGHNHPKINQTIARQLRSLEHVLFAGFTHRPAISLAEELVKLTRNKLQKVFFSDNGSTAVEVALKMSFQFWQNTGKPQKRNFISLDQGYHGDTIGTMSVSGVDLFNQVFSPLFFPSFKVPTPYCYRCPMGKNQQVCQIACIKPLEKLLSEKAHLICAMIIEPMILCAAGMLVYPKEYLEKVGTLCKKYNVHLILDEVATGFGRTGKMFAFEFVKNLTPDFLCLSKGITGGYLPLAATLTSDKIYQAFFADYDKKKTFFHGHTYTANPVSCSAALANLAIFKKERTLERIKEIIPLFHQGLEKFRELPLVGDVRYLGLIGAVELVQNKKSKERFNPKKRLGFAVYRQGLKKGLILRPLGDVIYLFLPLSVSKKELAGVLERTSRVLKEIG